MPSADRGMNGMPMKDPMGGTDGSPHRLFGSSLAPGWRLDWSSPVLHCGLIFALAFLIRIQFLAEILPHPLLDINQVRGTDMEVYIRWGWRIAQGNWLGHGEGPFYQGPAFPYFLALTFSLFGLTLFPAMVIQALLGSLSAVLIYWIGRRLFDVRVALVAGALAAAYSLFVFFGVILHSTTLEVFLACVALLVLVQASQRGGAWWLWAGGVVAVAALSRPNLLIVSPFIVTAILIRGWGGPVRPLVRAAGLFVVGFVLVIAPVTLRNLVVGKEFVVLSSAGPETFRITNSYDSTPLNFRYPKLPLMPLTSWAFWRHQIVKAGYFWWGFEAPQNVNFYLFRTASGILRAPLVAYWVLVPLAAAGLWIARRRWRDLLPVLAFGFGYYCSVVVFHIVGRFRLVLVPILLVLAACALVRAADLAATRRWTALGTGALVVAALMALVRPWGFPLIYPVDHANYGYILANRGELGAGVEELGLAELGLPGYPGLNYDMGRIHAMLGQQREALVRFEREVSFSPRHAEAFRSAGMAAREIGDKDRAVRYLERYLALAPDGPRAGEVREMLVAMRERRAGTR
jgi:4-amino-4-deoxy-L-arabinose transferase-like glycosyltransferase